MAEAKLASVIGEVDQRRSMFPFGSCPVHQSSPTSAHLTVALPGLAPAPAVRSSAVAGGRVSRPYRPVLRSSWWKCHHWSLDDALPSVSVRNRYPSRVTVATVTLPLADRESCPTVGVLVM